MDLREPPKGKKERKDVSKLSSNLKVDKAALSKRALVPSLSRPTISPVVYGGNSPPYLLYC